MRRSATRSSTRRARRRSARRCSRIESRLGPGHRDRARGQVRTGPARSPSSGPTNCRRSWTIRISVLDQLVGRAWAGRPAQAHRHVRLGDRALRAGRRSPRRRWPPARSPIREKESRPDVPAAGRCTWTGRSGRAAGLGNRRAWPRRPELAGFAADAGQRGFPAAAQVARPARVAVQGRRARPGRAPDSAAGRAGRQGGRAGRARTGATRAVRRAGRAALSGRRTDHRGDGEPAGPTRT